MSRLFLVFLGSVIFLMPPLAFAEEAPSEKAKVVALFKAYKASLKAGDTEGALKSAKQMHALTPVVYGKVSKTHATAAFNLAQLSTVLNHRKDTARYYQEHLDILDALKVQKNDRYLAKLGLLAGAYMKIHKADEAIKYGRRALGLAKELNVSDDIVAAFELNLGSYYYNSYGMGNKAKRQFKKAYELYSQLYGEDHIKTAQALFWLAKIDVGFKKNRRAAEKFENVLDIYNKELPAGDDAILQTHAFLVNVYEKMGDKEKSTEHCIAVATERPLDFDRELDALYKISPKYPYSAQKDGRQGHIIAEFTVDEFGQVKDIKTLEGKNIRTFEKSAHKALSQFRYAPSIVDGKRVETKGVLHKITFKMAPR
ncbi:MAG: hypothetical protein COB54_01410 [Alphaproteobacteria bacterium]|nr:MAG: hypothetical protein COB54_01410 [Alphaproteobacteria bacterium]